MIFSAATVAFIPQPALQLFTQNFCLIAHAYQFHDLERQSERCGESSAICLQAPCNPIQILQVNMQTIKPRLDSRPEQTYLDMSTLTYKLDQGTKITYIKVCCI